MATFFMSRYFASLTLFLFYFKVLNADPSSYFSFKSFSKDQNYESNIALYGDAKVVSGGSMIQLTDSVSSNAGRVIYKKPIKLVEGSPRNLASFSTNFSFSLSKESGDGLAFVMVPSGFNFSMSGNNSFRLPLELDKSKFRVVAVDFYTSRDVKYGDLNENHVGIDLGSLVSVKVSNVSSHNTVLNSSKKLNSWINYEASSKRLEVRLSPFDTTKPADPLLSYPIDLSKMWNDEEVFVGLSSSNRNSSQICYLYSWSFELMHVPHWMHSLPLDPKTSVKSTKSPQPLPNRSDCLLKVLGALIFGVACGALGASIVLYLWTIFANRRPIVPVLEECAVHTADFEYEKFKVVIDNVVEDGKKSAD